MFKGIITKPLNQMYKSSIDIGKIWRIEDDDHK